ncbi:MAG: NAD(P)-dependent oxidoreductase [Nitriliruptoraceae bacterium]
MEVGFAGVGTMGSRMAAAVHAAGHGVHVYDLAPERANETVEATGAGLARSPRELGEQAEIVLMSLPAPTDVRSVVRGPNGLLEAGDLPAVIVDLSTVDPMSTREHAAAAAERGVGYIDAPVLGRPSRCGHWTLPVGGATADLEAARAPLECVAGRIVHVGDVGSGNVIKLLNNLMFGAINAITVESMSIARRLGVDMQVFFDTIAESNAASVSNLFLEIGPKIVAGDTDPDFSLDLLQKDNLLALEMAREVRLSSVVGAAVTVLNGFGQDHGLGALDTSALAKFYESITDPGISDRTSQPEASS